MKLTQIRTIRKANNSLAKTIYRLQYLNRLKTYTVDGYKAYDEDEYEIVKQNVRLGRPLKKKPTKKHQFTTKEY